MDRGRPVGTCPMGGKGDGMRNDCRRLCVEWRNSRMTHKGHPFLFVEISMYSFGDLIPHGIISHICSFEGTPNNHARVVPKANMPQV